MPGNKLGREDSAGQNPYYPGEGAQPPGKKIESEGETTFIPIVDSIPHPKKSKT